MRKYELIEKTTKDSELKSVSCNKCGIKHVFRGEDHEREWQDNMFQSFKLSFGYGSKFDEEQWKFDLCEGCLIELVNSFVYKPEGYGE
ncbi:hypothetical protein NDK43_06805 [Neobacillus pocheonensis]|uniref:Uncharacterized protein n=1 Tax=Neobacillus pocheonensis TaxID=363869 RepID=A0ABT0W763_9BACI|nr:hypothetical protein [Neobacillus pocheonensis]